MAESKAMQESTSISEVTTEGALQPVEAQLVLVYNAKSPLDASIRVVLRDFHEVIFGRAADDKRALMPRGRKAERALRFELFGQKVSRGHARLFLRNDEWFIEDVGSSNGTLLDGRSLAPHVPAALADGAVIEIGPNFLVFRVGPVHVDQEIVSDDELSPPHPDLATHSGALGLQFRQLAEIAKERMPVLIRGASGTGKELVTRALHAMSGRSGSFIPVNLANYPEGLIGASLFGHAKGAFTGATDNAGLIRSAQGGTLFLDELGDVPLGAQASLLRAVENREVLPIGKAVPLSVDVRFAAATHRRLETMVADGTFRGDLLARLSGFVVKVPRLSERREDIGLLMRAIVRRLPVDRTSFQFSTHAARAILSHDWHDNIRGLSNAIERAATIARGRAIELLDLQLPEAASSAGDVPLQPRVEPERQAKALPKRREEAPERAELEALLHRHDWNIEAAARASGKHAQQIYRWMKKRGVTRPQ
jgi:DNA-binding NtrC family response regulator